MMPGSGMFMDKMKVLAMTLVFVLVITGAGTVIFYLQGESALREKQSIAVREEMLTELSTVQSEAQDALRSANENLTEASILLRTTGLNGTAAREVLAHLLANVNFAVDVVTIDAKGSIVAAEPAKYHEAEGTNISQQPQVLRMMETMMPVMSDVFVMVEGFTATDIEVPVFTTDGRFNGSVSVTLDLEGMLRDMVGSSIDLDMFQFTCLQTDGMEVFDTDEDQIGRNLFTDPVYQNYTTTLAFMHMLVGESAGYGTYDYYRTLSSRELAEKEVYWSSFGMHGVEWRLLIIHAK